MENTITYIVIAIIFIASVIIYNHRKKQTRGYLLSKQLFPKMDLSVFIIKHQNKINTISIKTEPFSEIIISSLEIELITRDRIFNHYCLDKLVNNTSFPIALKKSEIKSFDIPFEEFKSLLSDGELPFRTFRFKIVLDNKTSFKSHELGFNKKWIIYRPDSGHYN